MTKKKRKPNKQSSKGTSTGNRKKSGAPGIKYSPELGLHICSLISAGQSLRTICRNTDEMPSITVIFDWLVRYPDFAEHYARAKQEQAEALVEDMLEIADSIERDMKLGEDGRMRVDHEHIQRSRLRVDTRKFIAAKLKPKKYGERIINEHSGIDGAPIQQEFVVRIVDAPTAAPGEDNPPTP